MHVLQFVDNAMALGHQVWMWGRNEHLLIRPIPRSPLGMFKTLRSMDALYVRIDWKPPRACQLAIPPWRHLCRLPVVVWEFNTVPEFGSLRVASHAEVQDAIRAFRVYGRGCDLAVCVTPSLADYVRKELGIRRVLVVPNASDPDLFRTDAPPVRHVPYGNGSLNAVWIGCGDIPWHDFEMLRKAAEILWQEPKSRDITFHLIGPGLVDVMKSMPPNVNYYGEERYQELPRWLAAMDVGLILYRDGPAQHNGPLKLFDYMAGGLTVVSTPQTFVRSLFERLDQTDLLVSPGDYRRLAEILISLSTDRLRVRRQGMAGRQLVMKEYNWRRSTEIILAEIESIIKERNRSQVEKEGRSGVRWKRVKERGL